MSSQTDRNQNFILWLYLTAISLMWGSTFLLVKISVAAIPPFALTAIRAGIAAAAMSIWLMVQRQPLRLSHRQLIHAIVLGTVNVWLPDALIAFATLQIDSAKAGMLSASTPLFTALLAHILLRDEHLRWHQILGVVIGFVGTFLIVGPIRVLQGDVSTVGSLCILGMALSYAVGNIYGRWIRPENLVQLTMAQYFCGCLPVSLISLVVEPGWSFDFTPSVVIAVLVLGIFGAAIPNILFLYLLRWFAAINVSTISYLMPIWAIVLGVLILGESLSIVAVVGCMVALLGAWIVNNHSTSNEPSN